VQILKLKNSKNQYRTVWIENKTLVSIRLSDTTSPLFPAENPQFHQQKMIKGKYNSTAMKAKEKLTIHLFLGVTIRQNLKQE
jgi:hypothetical protein